MVNKMADYGYNNNGQNNDIGLNEYGTYGTNTNAPEVNNQDWSHSDKAKTSEEPRSSRDDRGYKETNNRSDEGFGSSYIKTSEGYVFPGLSSRTRNDRPRGSDYDRNRSRRRRSRSRSRSRERDRRSSSSSYSSSRDRGDRHSHRDRDRSRSRDRDRDRSRGDRDRRDRDRRPRHSEERPSGSNFEGDQYDRGNDPYAHGSEISYDSSGNNYGGHGFQSNETDSWQEHSDGYSGNRINEEDGNFGNKRINGKNWKDRLTSIREAHFNRSKQPPTIAQNQFQNDGSFMEMFRKKMQQSSQEGQDTTSVTPNSIVLASQSIPFSPELSLPPLTTSVSETASSSTNAEDVDGIPMVQKSLPMPVSMGKRRMAKPLKTGIVAKKPQNAQEDEGNQEQLDAWAHYLKEVQKYKSSKCMDTDESRPLVK